MKKVLFKTFIITLIISIFIQTISFFPLYAFFDLSEKESDISLNEYNDLNYDQDLSTYELEHLKGEYHNAYKRTDGLVEYDYYEELVNYYDGTSYQKVDATYYDDGASFKQQINKYSVYLPKKLHDSKKIKLDYNNSSIELTYQNINKTEGKKDISNDFNNIKDRVFYQNIFNDVDLSIESSGTYFKENIIINKYISDFSFSYVMKLNKLTLKKQQENYVFKDENNNIVYIIDPYFMIDQNNKISYDISLNIELIKKDEYLITVTPSNTYLQNATYPVVIDPIINYTSNSTTSPVIRTKSITKNTYIENNNQLQITKYVNNYNGIIDDISSIGLMEIDLSSLDPNYYITYASITLNGSDNYSNQASIGLISNKSFDEIDGYTSYNVTKKQDFSPLSNKLYRVDFSPYASTNKGKTKTYEISPTNFQNNGETHYYNTSNIYLKMIVLDASGLSPYRTYETLNVGYAGNVYIDHSLGNMILEHNNYSSNNLNLNFYFASSKSYTNIGFGMGFKTNYNETITESSNNKLSLENGTGYTEDFYYDTEKEYYRSEEGAKHYIIKTDTSYELYDGTTKKEYNQNGYLINIIYNYDDETNKKTITISYTFNAIDKITLDDYYIEFNYTYPNGTKLLSYTTLCKQVDEQTKEVLETTEYIYENNYLKLIIKYKKDIFDEIDKSRPENEELPAEEQEEFDPYIIKDRYCIYTAYFQYDQYHYLNKAYQNINYPRFNDNGIIYPINEDIYSGININYSNDKVINYSQKLTNNNSETYKCEITYADHATTYTDSTGYSRTYVFDYFFHTINVMDSLNKAAYYEYIYYMDELLKTNPDYTKKNKIKNINDNINIGMNYIKNGNFEQTSESITPNSKYWKSTTSCGEFYQTNNAPFEYHVLKLSKQSNNQVSEVYQEVELGMGTYNLSTYARIYKTQLASSDTTGYIKIIDIFNNVIAYEEFTNKTYEEINTTFSLDMPYKVKVVLGINTTNTDKVFFDNIQLTKDQTYNKYNLINNPSFEHFLDVTEESSEWENLKNKQSERYIFDETLGTFEARISPQTSITQRLNFEVQSGYEFNIGAVCKNYDGADINVKIKFLNTTNNTETPYYVLQFSKSTTEYHYGCADLTVMDGKVEGLTYNQIEITITNNGIADGVIDNIALYPLKLHTDYKYDDNGLVTQVTTPNKTTNILYDAKGEIHALVTDGVIVSREQSIKDAYSVKQYTQTKINEATNNTTVQEFIKSKDNPNEEYTFVYDVNNNTKYGFFTSQVYENLTLPTYTYKDEFGGLTKVEIDETNYKNYTTLPNNIRIEETYDYNGRLNHYELRNTNNNLNNRLEMISYIYNSDNQVTNIIPGIDNTHEIALNYNQYGDLISVRQGSRIIKTYEYMYINNESTGILTKEINQNGDYIRYTYDNYYNLIACYKGNINNNSVDSQEILCYTCKYDDQNNLTYYNDLIENKKYFYSYDLNNNLTKVTTTKTDENNNVTEDYIEYIYNDETKNIESTKICINGNIKETIYEYDNDEINSSEINDLIFISPTKFFSGSTKFMESQIKQDSHVLIDSKYYFRKSTTSFDIVSEENIALTSSQIDKQVIFINNASQDYEIRYNYLYDYFGNISQIKYSKVKVIIVGQQTEYEIIEEKTYDYSYNYRNELSSEQITNNGKKLLTQYRYDDYGNIKNITISDITYVDEIILSTETFTYNQYNEMTSYTKNGVTITINYDSSRNITSYNGYTLIYDGTNLKEVRDSDNQIIESYKYNAQGIRISKETTNEKIEYSYIGDKLYQEIRYNKQSNEITTIINYIYDSTGKLVGFEANEQRYFYIRNLTNQIDYIVDDQGNLVAEYQYDAYGNIVNEASLSAIGQLNPIRYKGYYYDVETQLFYCNSRYYSPELCRFISPDSIEYLDPQSINGLNLYAYCGNDPVMCRLGYNLGGEISAPISNIGSISSNISSRSRSSSARIMSRVSASSTPFANVVSMTNYSTTLVDNILIGMSLGNISHTITTQHNDSGVFYRYSNIGNSTSSKGVGLNIRDWYGLNAYVSSNIGIGSSVQLGSITYGAEISVLDGISFSFGTVTGNVTNETTVSIGWGTLAFAYAACGATAAIPVPFARAVAGVAVCVVVLIDIFN